MNRLLYTHIFNCIDSIYIYTYICILDILNVLIIIIIIYYSLLKLIYGKKIINKNKLIIVLLKYKVNVLCSMDSLMSTV